MDTLLLHMMIIVTLAVQVKPGDQKENIARGKPTKFSATASIQTSDLAVDGDPDTFALSVVQTTPTWRVDLQSIYRVEAVSITNRKDCCPEKLDGARIHVGIASSGMPRCAVVSAVPLGETYTYSCHGMEGRYVSVVIPGDGNQLALAEVQVFGKPAENLALGKEAIQSSDFFSWETFSRAGYAVDGSRANSDHSVCSGTNGQDYPWWRVDLLEEYYISTVTITSRGDCCEDLLKRAEIHVSNWPDIDPNSDETLCVVMKNGIARGATNTYSCSNMAGRYVAIFGPGQNGYVFLCEVEVTGLPTVIPTPTPVPTIPPATPPPPLSLLVSGRIVVLVREQLNWFDALLHCRSLYRDLASLRNPEEQLDVGKALLLHEAQTGHVWLGLRRRMLSSDWYWMNGDEMDHSSWEGEKAQYHAVQRISSCGAAANMEEFQWSHRPCMEQLNFLCYTDDDPDYSPVQFTVTYARK